MVLSNDKWRKIVIDHYKNPKYQGFVSHPKAIVHQQPNVNCSDHLKLQLVLEEEKIISARFEGVACILSIASADIICHNLINKSVIEAKKILNAFCAMIKDEPFDLQVTKDLQIFLGSQERVFRQNCILLAADGFLAMLEKNH